MGFNSGFKGLNKNSQHKFYEKEKYSTVTALCYRSLCLAKEIRRKRILEANAEGMEKQYFCVQKTYMMNRPNKLTKQMQQF